MSSREPPPSFAALSGALHQDAVVFYGGSLEKQADDCVSLVQPEHRADLSAYLSGVLERRDNGELTRLLRTQEHIDVAMSRKAWWHLLSLVKARLAD